MIRRIAVAACLGLSGPALADDAALAAMQDYLMFAAEAEGIIAPQQIDRAVFEAALFVDTRSAAEFAQSTIPGAVHIGWREVLERLDEIPQDRMTIVFCATGILSAQATFALRVAGRRNVVVLQSGFPGWQDSAAYRP